MTFVWTVAWRLLREGRFQTVLILAGVSIGVAVIVYITAIVNGLQANIIDRTLSSQAHVVLRPADRLNQPALAAADGVSTLADVRKRTQRENTIRDWAPLLQAIHAHPRVSAAAVMASGPGVAQQGGVNKSVSLMGVALGLAVEAALLGRAGDWGHGAVSGERVRSG
jgi:lipoprotein-releasing system permease protein